MMREQPYTLKRDGLSKELANILRYPVTLIAAPMGYGKSTAVFSYLENVSTQWVMCSFDSIISKAEHIWSLLASQLEKEVPQLGRQLFNLGYPSDYAMFEKVIEVFEEYCSENELIFIIDDFHNVQSNEFIEIAQQIIMRHIEGLHFLIISRKIPDVRLEELVLKNVCYLIDSRAFELNQSEIYSYFQMYGVQLTEEELKQVHKISEGWISAICLLQRRYMQTRQITGEHGIESLLESASRYLYSQTEFMVLKKLALLDNFTLPLAMHLIDDQRVERVLMRMCHHNLFIRFDMHDNTYRMHNILRSFLKKVAIKDLPELDEKDIFRKAGMWYLRAGNTIQGLTYLLKAEDYQGILSEFEKTGITRYYDQVPSVIVDIFENIPLEERYKNPVAYLSYIGFYITNVDAVSGYDLFSDTVAQFAKTVHDADMFLRISGECELIRGYINFNDLHHMKINLANAHNMLKGKSLIANAKKIPTFGSPHILYLYFRSDMEIFNTVSLMTETYPYYYALSGGCGDGFIHQINAEAYLETGDYTNAEHYAKKAIYSAQGTGQLAVSLCSYFTLARLYAAMGDAEKGLSVIRQQRESVWNMGPPMLIQCYELTAAYIECIFKAPEDLPKWIVSGDLSKSDILYQGAGFSYIVYGKYLVTIKNYLRLEVLCERMQKAYTQFKNQIGFLHMHLLGAIAKHQLYGFEAAEEDLKKALEIGSANNMTTIFAEYGDAFLALLSDYQKSSGAKTQYINSLAEAAKAYGNNAADKTQKSMANLTQREMTILSLICNGRTNREVAEELFIAEITVRKNLTSIYRKLNVPNRASAVRKMLESSG